MEIPIPCNFGEYAKCNNKYLLPFVGLSWFKWSRGTEYTYFFSTGSKWQQTDFFSTFETSQPYKFVIPDNLLEDTFFKYRGYPLKGRGYANGVYYVDGKTYIDFILTDMYFSHIKVQCDSEGKYIQNGNIIFPTGWDSKKQERVIRKGTIHE